MTMGHLGVIQITRVAQSCCLGNQAECVQGHDISLTQQHTLTREYIYRFPIEHM